jgi:hypothetical protein
VDGSARPFWSIVNLMDKEDELECSNVLSIALNVRFGECQARPNRKVSARKLVAQRNFDGL